MHVQPRSRLARNMCFLDVTVSSYRVSLWSGYGSGAYIFVVGATSNDEREGIFERIPPRRFFAGFGISFRSSQKKYLWSL